MPVQNTFIPPDRAPFIIDENEIKLDPPLNIEEQPKQPFLSKLLPIIMMGVMFGMMALMFGMMRQNGGAMNPMMLMMPVMMMMSMLMMFTGANNNDSGSLDIQRKDYSLALREKRKEVHAKGQALHEVQETSFPNPSTLEEYIGSTDTDYPIMWQANPLSKTGITAYPGSIDEISFSPWMSARMGTGITNLLPAITFDPLPITETLEPVTTSSFRNFVRVQAFVPNTPIAFNLFDTTALALEGDKEKRMGLARAILMSIAFNHSPNYFRIVIITDNPESPQWQWAKWLPHCVHPTKKDRIGNARLILSSMKEFETLCPDALREYQEGNLMYLVFIDKPNHQIYMPDAAKARVNGGRLNSTFVVVSAGADYIATSKSARFTVSEDGIIQIPSSDAIINADYVEIYEAEHFARSMARWKPEEVTVTIDGEEVVQQNFKKLSWFEVLGIYDLETWNPSINWEQNAYTQTFEVPIGYGRIENSLTPEIVTMNPMENAHGGYGPHGVGAGATGTGKSVMIGGYVLGLMSLYGPDKINFILMDFKGASTFIGFDTLPHVIAVISNLSDSVDLLERAQDIIEGEILRRQEVLIEYGVKDILDYREKQKNNPGMPPMADLFIVADEFVEFLTKNRQYSKLFDSIARVGRSLGMHLFLVSQVIDSSVLGDVKAQLGYGISLTAANSRDSTEVIKTDRAVHLPRGKGDAIAYYSNRPGGEHTDLRTFFTEELYYPPEKKEEVQVVQAQEFDYIDDIDSDNTEEIIEYPVYNDFTEITTLPQDTPGIVEEDTREDRKPLGTMRDLIIKKISEYTDITAPQLWKPPLRLPISFANISPQDMSSSYPKIDITLGIEDVPIKHMQVPYTFTPSDSRHFHGFISGDPGSGKTTALQALIASTARSYLPGQVQYLILAFDGGEITAIKDYPHVVGIGGRNDDDVVERFMGEALRVINLRAKKTKELGIVSLRDYLIYKESNDIPNDPYGHLFLIVEGIGKLRTQLGSESDEARQDFDAKMKNILNVGPEYGVHVIITGTDIGRDAGYGIIDSFGFTLRLRSETIDSPQEIREKLKTITHETPGMSVDPDTNLFFRTLVPISEKIEPDRVEMGVEIYSRNRDFLPQIKSEAAAVRQQYEKSEVFIPPIVTPVPDIFHYKDMYNAASSYLGKGQRTAQLPIGVSTEDVSLIDIVSIYPVSPHLLILGTNKSGKTNVLRTVINDVYSQKSPREAQFIIFDNSGELAYEANILKKAKRLLGYCNSVSEFEKLMGKVASELKKRIPEDMLSLTREDRNNRSWYTGPDIYILVDNVMLVCSNANLGPNTEEVSTILKDHNDLGCYLYLTSNSSDAGSVDASYKPTLQKVIMDTNAPVLMLSGPKDHGRIRSIPFEILRPGKGNLLTANGRFKIQTAYCVPWEESMKDS